MNYSAETAGPLADDDAIALPPVHFDGILGVHGGEVVAGRAINSRWSRCVCRNFANRRVGEHRLLLTYEEATHGDLMAYSPAESRLSRG
jgi:hypothetical protein